MDNEYLFMKSFKKCRKGEISPVLYCNNVAIIGKTLVDNREQIINRGHKQQTEIKWASKQSKHFWDQARRPDRMISALDAICTMQHGIRFRSDVKKGNRWEKRAVYLWRNFVVVSRVHPKHLVTCYRIDPILKSVFDWYATLTEEESKALRKAFKKTVKPQCEDYNIYKLIGTPSEANYNSLHGL